MIFSSLYSGSSGNSIFLSSDNTKILIDAGMPGKSIENALKDIGEKAEEIDAIFVTHEHTDHTKGVGVLSRKYDIPIYASEGTWKGMIKQVGKIKDNNIRVMNSPISIKDMDIASFAISHDALQPTGYSIICEGKKACIATDLGYLSEEVKDNIIDADLLLLESNHDVEMLKFGPYPYVLKKRILSDVGHLSNEACGKAIIEIMTEKQKKIVLGHLSKTNNYPELAYLTVANILKEEKINIGKDVILTMADRSKPSSYIKL
ncbi:MAG: MBL fold metallo-hydrolase [Clostridiales bacterium]|uniref:MBL fold metallo-hydrolase n=1 Tax=Clostridium sp. N3C TaxID=1776758 RepID=UPI00092DF3E8|nr:MBL fold metallo-hydrolase [Clostridium sp. N3C]NLZ49337.1 MBL fold metallo-hydrolase [Clostridiales bacterium]SCN25358.1 putative metallo-hydrolase YycJ [Clostridium sp. N3C]